jgi:Ca2+-binding EF-hand superfamily protein
LYEFNLLFKQLDEDNDGILNEHQLRQLLVSMSVVVATEQDLDTLLKVVDPNNNKTVTYSQIVQLLST